MDRPLTKKKDSLFTRTVPWGSQDPWSLIVERFLVLLATDSAKTRGHLRLQLLVRDHFYILKNNVISDVAKTYTIYLYSFTYVHTVTQLLIFFFVNFVCLLIFGLLFYFFKLILDLNSTCSTTYRRSSREEHPYWSPNKCPHDSR